MFSQIVAQQNKYSLTQSSVPKIWLVSENQKWMVNFYKIFPEIISKLWKLAIFTLAKDILRNKWLIYLYTVKPPCATTFLKRPNPLTTSFILNEIYPHRLMINFIPVQRQPQFNSLHDWPFSLKKMKQIRFFPCLLKKILFD